jgi:hypothetical protein
MKKLMAFTAFAIFITACSKDTPTPPTTTTKTTPTIGQTDNAAYKSGSIMNYFIAGNAATIAVPLAGDSQVWNYASLNDSMLYNDTLLAPIANADFASATYMNQRNAPIGFGTINRNMQTNIYFENSTAGHFNLGFTVDTATFVVPLPTGTVTLKLLKQNVVAKEPLAIFPMNFKDDKTTTVTQTVNFTIQVPFIYPTPTPAQSKTSMVINNNVLGSGTINLKGFTAPVKVLMQKITNTSTVNYLVNGAAPNPILLTGAGLKDGAVTKTVTYNFYGVGLGLVGRLTTDSAGTKITSAVFLKK